MNGSMRFLAADWPAPDSIRAGTTLRHGGFSTPPFAGLNLGDHVGDDPQAVAANRKELQQQLALPAAPVWLEQVHGTTVVDAAATHASGAADASVATAPDAVCAVLTADCLPVLFCDHAGSCWGAAHAGWRGLAAGILEATVEHLPAAPQNLLAWLGPAIGSQQFEVGQDVVDAFVSQQADDRAAFTPCATPGKYLADIYALARARLRRAGVAAVHGGGLCTVSAPEDFHSYRRDGQAGRMASLVWRTTV